MRKKKSLLTLVLESYKSACRTLAGLEKDGAKADPLSPLTSQLIEMSYTTQLSMFRNVLMDADLGSDAAVEVEQALKDVETEHPRNKEILDSVRMIRAELQVLQS